MDLGAAVAQAGVAVWTRGAVGALESVWLQGLSYLCDDKPGSSDSPNYETHSMHAQSKRLFCRSSKVELLGYVVSGVAEVFLEVSCAQGYHFVPFFMQNSITAFSRKLRMNQFGRVRLVHYRVSTDKGGGVAPAKRCRG